MHNLPDKQLFFILYSYLFHSMDPKWYMHTEKSHHPKQKLMTIKNAYTHTIRIPIQFAKNNFISIQKRNHCNFDKTFPKLFLKSVYNNMHAASTHVTLQNTYVRKDTIEQSRFKRITYIRIRSISWIKINYHSTARVLACALHKREYKLIFNNPHATRTSVSKPTLYVYVNSMYALYTYITHTHTHNQRSPNLA